MGGASGEESLSDLQARMNDIQAQLDATTAKVEEAHSREEALQNDIDSLNAEKAPLEKQMSRLQKIAEERARTLYEEGNTGMLELLLDGASDVGDLAARADMLARVSTSGTDEFIKLARAQDRLDDLVRELEAKSDAHAQAEADLKDEADRFQAQLDSVSDEYEKLQKKLGPSAPAATHFASAAAAPLPSGGGKMYCPVGGPVSFVDSYGAPRSGGRTHEGVDMMAAYGTPEIAIVSGTITYAGYDELGGNIMYLSGDDGNLYVYIHSATQLTGGHVTAGQQIGTVGDTGNAAGNPHLHFEYHPGGGGPVNPTPLAASVC
jgi:murein DD-endopeptidase MepM/ murein hydrolase activator NlpD